MTVILALLIASLAAVSIGLVLWPLLLPKGSDESANGPAGFSPRTNRGERPPAASAERVELLTRRDVFYTTLREVEFDRQMGKLDEDDYQALRRRYVLEAAEVLRQLEQITPEIDAQIYAEIEAAVSIERTRLAGPDEPALAGEDFPAGEAGRKNAPVLLCPECGRPVKPGDEFCVFCGVSLRDVCQECGTPRRLGAAFCARCGAAFKINHSSPDGITPIQNGKPNTDDVS